MEKHVFYSPAKINLFLRVLNKRDDGYHNIASLFQAVDVFDTLEFQLSEIDFFTCNDSDLPMDSSNLILRALDLFRRKTQLKFNVSVTVDKLIPTKAGMGGGSSNAATTLWALNQILGKPATTAELMRWSEELGSDVPFFFSHGTAMCTGRGEIVDELPPLMDRTLWLFKPAKGLSTPEVFANVDLNTLVDRDPELILQGFFNNKPVFFNDLEEAAMKVMPALREFKEKVQNMGFNVLCMTGSGTAFICDLRNPEDETIYPPVHYVNRESDGWYIKVDV